MFEITSHYFPSVHHVVVCSRLRVNNFIFIDFVIGVSLTYRKKPALPAMSVEILSTAAQLSCTKKIKFIRFAVGNKIRSR